MSCDIVEYYRDCYLWLPDIIWGKEDMTVCPDFQSNERVGPHGFQKEHHSRHIFGLT